MTQELDPIGPDEIAYRLDLTPAQLKVLHLLAMSWYGPIASDMFSRGRGVW